MPDESSQLAVQSDDRASVALAKFIGMDQHMMIDTIREQCFTRPKDGSEITDFQVAAFISIAVEMKVNPLLPGMLYAMVTQGGKVVPMMGPDGVFKKLSEHPGVDSWDVTVFPEDPTVSPTYAIARIYRKGATHPVTYTATLKEWKIDKNPNWNDRPRHMLQLRALKHAARQVIHGLPYDDDDKHIIELNDVPLAPGAEAEQAPTRPPARRRQSGAAGASTPASEPINVTPTTPAPVTPPANPKPADPAPAAPVLALPKDGGTSVLPGCIPTEIVCDEVNDQPSVIAKIKWTDQEVEVYHMGGATKTGDAMTANAPWKLETPLTIKLRGKKLKSGSIVYIVEAVELTEPAKKAGKQLE